MPHAMPRGHSKKQSRQAIKPDPDSTVATLAASSDTTNSVHGTASSAYLPFDQSFSRNNRSDAPTPSERLNDPEPLLREVRARVDMAPESPNVLEESFFHRSFEDIGKKLKECNDTLGELQQLGVSHDVQLPELVLVGDQSAGKSSLMSGLANLDLPRSEGTCTRCPLHIRVSRHTDWSCRVWLRKEYSYEPPDDRDIQEQDVTDEDPFFPWRKKATNSIHEFKTMHDKSEIEEVLRWAQVAILNDHKHFAHFVPGSGAIAVNSTIATASDDRTAKFSPNVVALEIKGPELPDLSFYDMPGIFQNPADARDDYLVSVVRNLSKEYIQHPTAIIMCSMPMNIDAELSCTFGLIRRLEASSRTIGVLTKADLIPQGTNHSQWLDIMNGAAHRTGHGYFITSRPQNKSLEDLPEHEERAFETHAYDWWPEEFHQFGNHCGVERLKAFLSERLGEEFAKSLPTIKHKIKLHLDKITRELGKLPELPDNVELEVQTSLINFADDARRCLDGFTTRINHLPSNFRDCLQSMKPRVILKDRTDCPVMEISDDESDNTSVAASQTATPSNKRQRLQHAQAQAQQTPSKRRRTDPANHGANGSFGTPTKTEDDRDSFPTPRPAPARGLAPPDIFAEFKSAGRGFRTLRQVREDIQSRTRAGRPNLIPDQLYCDLAMQAVKPWNKPMWKFLELIMRQLHSELKMALDKAFEGLKKRFVYQEAMKHLQVYIETHHQSMAEELQQLYLIECEELLTMNQKALDQERAEEDHLLKRHRHYMRMNAQLRREPLPKPEDWELMTEEKRLKENKEREAEVRGIGPDPFEREVEVMAYVRGYYRLAAHRFADNVTQRIICRMIPQVRRNLSQCLEHELGLRGPDVVSVYEALMAEDQATAEKRVTLRAERTKFETALGSIEMLEMGGTRDGVDGDVMDEDGQQQVNGLQDGETVTNETVGTDEV